MTVPLKDSMSSISSDLYEEILKPNKSHINRIIQIVPCNGGLTRNDLYEFLHQNLHDTVFKR